jgi:hypothetical protein
MEVNEFRLLSAVGADASRGIVNRQRSDSRHRAFSDDRDEFFKTPGGSQIRFPLLKFPTQGPPRGLRYAILVRVPFAVWPFAPSGEFYDHLD